MSSTPAKVQGLQDIIDPSDVNKDDYDRMDQKELKTILNQKHLINFENAIFNNTAQNAGDINKIDSEKHSARKYHKTARHGLASVSMPRKTRNEKHNNELDPKRGSMIVAAQSMRMGSTTSPNDMGCLSSDVNNLDHLNGDNEQDYLLEDDADDTALCHVYMQG